MWKTERCSVVSDSLQPHVAVGHWVAFPSPGDLPNPGIEPGSPALQADSLPYKPPGKLCFSLKAAVSLPPSTLYNCIQIDTFHYHANTEKVSRIEVSKRSGISVWFVCWHIPRAQNTRLAHGRLWINSWEWSGTSLFVTPASQPSLLNSRLIHATNH